MVILAFLAVVLFGGAIGVGYMALRTPHLRRSRNLDQIEAYGYAAHKKPPAETGTNARQAMDAFAASIGNAAARRFHGLREDEIQRELISAGLYDIGARRFLGYRVLFALGLPIFLVWLFGVAGISTFGLVMIFIVALVCGWIVPSFIVHRRSHQRLQTIDDSLPELIDLLVVTLEAGVSFAAAMRLSAERLEGPLGDEVRLTIQEQTLGLSTLVSLENWLKRCETPSVRSFVRAMVQGDRLGVSIGSILRNLAVEMRARRKAVIEERAQKAPVKILFPLVFLIFPAIFVIILGPAIFSISSSLK